MSRTAMRRWLFAPTDFAHSRLVLASAHGWRRRLRGALGWVLAAAAGAIGMQAWDARQAALPPVAAMAVPTDAALRQDVEQARLQLRVAEGRGQELERQVDALNQQLRAAQEELTFFHKARESRSR